MRTALTIIAMLLTTASVLAQAPSVPPAKEAPADAEATIHNYGTTEKTCLRWTDGCRTCARLSDGSQICSNVGIACQPVAITCVTRQEPPAPK
jgi:hypothetical protein